MSSLPNRPPSPFTHPRPPPSVPSHSHSHSHSHSSSHSDLLVIRRTAAGGLSVAPVSRSPGNAIRYDYYDLRYAHQPVRHQGPVDVQFDTLRGWAWTRRVWMVLDDTCLKYSPKKGAEPSDFLRLREIRCAERVNASKQHCLMVASSAKTWYLFFKDVATLNAWEHDIRIRCRFLRIGKPTDYRHIMHVTYDRAAQEIAGLPEAWIKALSAPQQFKAPSPEVPPTPPPKDTNFIRPKPPPPRHERSHTPRARSRSEAVPLGAHSRVPSTIVSVEQFRRSPHRYREVEARDLTGTVRTVQLLPASRHDNCDVWRGEWAGSFGTREVAIQVIRLSDPISKPDRERLRAILLEEVKALHQLRHPNVVRTRGFSHDHGGNTLEKVVKLRLLTQVASGLTYLHEFSRSIVHGEVRGANIMITEKGAACITGYGLNPVMQELDGDPHSYSPFRLSPRWAANEVILRGRRHITHQSDVFSFGRTVLEVMTGKDPFYYVPDDAGVAHAVLRGAPPRRPPVFGDDGLWYFLERCWHDAPAQRPSMAAVLLRMEETFGLYDGAAQEVQEEEEAMAMRGLAMSAPS